MIRVMVSIVHRVEHRIAAMANFIVIRENMEELVRELANCVCADKDYVHTVNEYRGTIGRQFEADRPFQEDANVSHNAVLEFNTCHIFPTGREIYFGVDAEALTIEDVSTGFWDRELIHFRGESTYGE